MARVTNSSVYRRHIDDADVPGGDRSSANVIQLDGRCVPPKSATARTLRCSSRSLCAAPALSNHPLLFILVLRLASRLLSIFTGWRRSRKRTRWVLARRRMCAEEVRGRLLVRAVEVVPVVKQRIILCALDKVVRL